MTGDPLLALVIDAAEVDRQRIAEALTGVLSIDKGGRVIPSLPFNSLNSSQKILAFLLGRKVASLLKLSDGEAVSPQEIAQDSGMPRGTEPTPVSRSVWV